MGGWPPARGKRDGELAREGEILFSRSSCVLGGGYMQRD